MATGSGMLKPNSGDVYGRATTYINVNISITNLFFLDPVLNNDNGNLIQTALEHEPVMRQSSSDSVALQ